VRYSGRGPRSQLFSSGDHHITYQYPARNHNHGRARERLGGEAARRCVGHRGIKWRFGTRREHTIRTSCHERRSLVLLCVFRGEQRHRVVPVVSLAAPQSQSPTMNDTIADEVRHSSNLLFQNLIFHASFNPEVLPLGSESCTVDPTAPCDIWWGGGDRHRSYTSVILIGNGLSFLCQSLIFLSIGSLADYGNWNPWVVRTFSVICWAFEFGFLGVKTADKWQAAMALYILSSECLPTSSTRQRVRS
jgi:hypothetical protein